MLIAVALVPGTVLLVPGAGGREDDGIDVVRAAASAAIVSVFRSGADRVVVIAPGREDRHLVSGWRAGLGEVGIADGHVGWTMPARSVVGRVAGRGADDASDAGVVPAGGAHGPDREPVPVLVCAVASAALAMTEHVRPDGWAGSLEVLEVRAPRAGVRTAASRAEELRAHGRTLERASGHGALGLVVAGSLSARNGPDGPLAADDRAPELDRDVAAHLADGGPEARRRLGGLDPDTAADLGMSGWAPWQVLLGACHRAVGIEVEEVASARRHGVVHVSASWRCTGARS